DRAMPAPVDQVRELGVAGGEPAIAAGHDLGGFADVIAPEGEAQHQRDLSCGFRARSEDGSDLALGARADLDPAFRKPVCRQARQSRTLDDHFTTGYRLNRDILREVFFRNSALLGIDLPVAT